MKKKEAREKKLREKELEEKELREYEIKVRELGEKQKEENYDSLLAYTNPLLDCDVSFLKDDVGVAPKEESKVQVDNILCEFVCKPLYKNPFVLMPREELYIREPWTKQLEENEVPKEFELPIEKIPLSLTTSSICNLE